MDYAKYLSPTGPMAQPYVKLNSTRICRAKHLSHLPAAAPIAKMVLAQGASASQAERSWKIYGRIMTPQRAAMSHEKADMRVFQYNYLQVKRRTEKSNWAPAVVEWADA